MRLTFTRHFDRPASIGQPLLSVRELPAGRAARQAGGFSLMLTSSVELQAFVTTAESVPSGPNMEVMEGLDSRSNPGQNRSSRESVVKSPDVMALP